VSFVDLSNEYNINVHASYPTTLSVSNFVSLSNTSFLNHKILLSIKEELFKIMPLKIWRSKTHAYVYNRRLLNYVK